MTWDEPVVGPHGHAESVDLNVRSDADATICAWLITSPPWHPAWSQYFLAVIDLGDVEGFPPAKLKFMGATHELIVFVLDPGDPLAPTIYTVESLAQTEKIAKLNPINIVEQFEATDEEMQQVAFLAANAVVNGHLNPETADAPERIRESWLAAVTKTLAHIRGEEHDRS